MRRGFVDLQMNGWKMTNFSGEGLPLDQVQAVTRSLVAKGTLAYCPTVGTAPFETILRNFGILARAKREPDLAPHILGFHLEGPFISPEPGARGGHPPEYVRRPSVRDFEKCQEAAEGGIVLLTVAPERPGALDLIRHAAKRGVAVSLGHHLADSKTMGAAVRAGVRVCTHIGNGIPNLIHRHQNPLWWQLASDDVWGMFITDGHHLPAPFIKVALRAKTVNRFVVTSDASISKAKARPVPCPIL